jgi:DNA-binding NarL/FixJ family response regulator
MLRMSPRRRTTPVRVLIADDHRLFAEALEAILDGERGLRVVGRAADGQEAIELARTLTPDVVLLDISMPVLDGFEAAAAITKLPEAPAVVMLTGSDAAQDVDRARRAGASGYVTKDAIAARLVSAILAAAGGH